VGVMARKHEASKLLKEGNNPFEISKNMGISVASVMQYLLLQIMEGAIQKSDHFCPVKPKRGITGY
jgi:predicted transcriptional regulator